MVTLFVVVTSKSRTLASWFPLKPGHMTILIEFNKLKRGTFKDRRPWMGRHFTVALFSTAILVTIPYYISNDREYFSLSNDMNNLTGKT